MLVYNTSVSFYVMMHVLIPLMQFLVADKGMASGEAMDIFGMSEGTSDVI